MKAKAEATITVSIDEIVLRSLEDAGHHAAAIEAIVETQQARIEALEGEVAELKARLNGVAELARKAED